MSADRVLAMMGKPEHAVYHEIFGTLQEDE